MSRQAVTKHLIQLEEANLVEVRWEGRGKVPLPQPRADPRDHQTLDQTV